MNRDKEKKKALNRNDHKELLEDGTKRFRIAL